jgi:hypothetical protein
VPGHFFSGYRLYCSQFGLSTLNIVVLKLSSKSCFFNNKGARRHLKHESGNIVDKLLIKLRISAADQRLLLNHELIVSELDIVRQKARIAFVKNIVIEMGQEGTPGSEVFDNRQSFLETKVGCVGLDADAIEDKHIEIAKPFHRGRGNYFKVGRICKIVKPICNDGQFSVDHLNRRDLEVVSDTEWRIGLNRMWDELRQSAPNVGWIENILKNSPKVFPCNLIRVDTHCPVTKVQWPYVIESKNMIDMTMRDQYGIKLPDVRSKSLLAKVD